MFKTTLVELIGRMPNWFDVEQRLQVQQIDTNKSNLKMTQSMLKLMLLKMGAGQHLRCQTKELERNEPHKEKNSLNAEDPGS